MKLNDIFTRNVVTAWPEETLATVALRMQEHNVGTVVIVEDERPEYAAKHWQVSRNDDRQIPQDAHSR